MASHLSESKIQSSYRKPKALHNSVPTASPCVLLVHSFQQIGLLAVFWWRQHITSQGLSICCLLCLELFSQRPACLTPSVRLSVSKYSNASRYSSATLTEELSPGILPESDTSPIHLSTIRPFSCLVFLHSSSSPCINYMSICLFQVCLFLLECNYSILHSQSLKHCLAHERIQ